jgi:hypothetical protein
MTKNLAKSAYPNIYPINTVFMVYLWSHPCPAKRSGFSAEAQERLRIGKWWDKRGMRLENSAKNSNNC